MSLLPMAALLAVFLLVLAVIVLVLRAAGNARNPVAVSAARAQVLGVREVTSGTGVQHWVAFRFADAHQRELMATPSQAAVIFRGQAGVVHFAGDRLTGWVPELGPGPQDSHRSE